MGHTRLVGWRGNRKALVAACLALAFSVFPLSIGTTAASTTVSWKQVAPIPNASLLARNRALEAATVGIDGKAYVETHCTHWRCVPTPTEVYDGVTNSWSQAAPSPGFSLRTLPWAAATGTQGKIYAIGGGYADTTGIYPSADLVAYSSKTNTWVTKAPMATARAYLAASVGPDGLIYALGGAWVPYQGQFWLPSTATMEVYNPNTNMWVGAAPMQQARDSFAAVLGPDQRLYAIGGRDQYFDSTGGCCLLSQLQSVEAYSFSTATWTYVKPFPWAGPTIGAVTGSDGRIYAVGSNNMVAAYNLSQNLWYVIPSPPLGGAPAGGAVLVTAARLSNGRTAVLVLDNVCDYTSTGTVVCSYKTFTYAT